MSRMVPEQMHEYPDHWLWPTKRTTHPSFMRFFRPKHREPQPVSWTPDVDLVENDNEYVVVSELPGVDPQKVEILVNGTTLTIKGSKKSTNLEECDIHHVESCFGPFKRSLNLPGPIDADSVEATHNLGVLAIRLPKKARSRSIKIKVR